MAVRSPRATTLAWASKEAVLKALGRGLDVDPRDVAITVEGAESRVHVALIGEAARQHQALGGGELGLSWEDHGDQVIVIARLAA